MKKGDDWGQYFGRPMKCDGCDACFENPRYPGRCIYGGPFRRQSQTQQHGIDKEQAA
jgi:hypothetical protein